MYACRCHRVWPGKSQHFEGKVAPGITIAVSAGINLNWNGYHQLPCCVNHSNPLSSLQVWSNCPLCTKLQRWIFALDGAYAYGMMRILILNSASFDIDIRHLSSIFVHNFSPLGNLRLRKVENISWSSWTVSMVKNQNIPLSWHHCKTNLHISV